MYKKSISQNLEFIADAGAIQLMQDKQAYQKTLLKITVQPDCINLTNHFYQSLIKKRIIMLNKQKSHKGNSLKYVVVLPALVAFVLAFQVKVVAQEKTGNKLKANSVIYKDNSNNTQLTLTIDKDTKDADLEHAKKTAKEEFKADLSITNLKRNSKSEITAIKVALKGDGQDGVYEVAGNQPIQPFTIEMASDEEGNNIISFGSPNDIRTSAAFPKPNMIFHKVIGDTAFYDKHQIIKPMPVPAPYAMAAPSKNNVSLKFGNTEALVVINGIKYAKGQEITLPAGHQITKLTTLDGKEGKKKYGKEGKKGVVEINTAATGYAADAYGFAYQNPGNMMYFKDQLPFEFNADDFIKGDMAFVMKDIEGHITNMTINDYIDDEWIEGYRKLIDEMKLKSDLLEQNFDSGNFEAERNKAVESFDAKRAELDKKRDEAKKKKAAVEKERQKAEEARKASKTKQ
jgi:hypothetical protein